MAIFPFSLVARLIIILPAKKEFSPKAKNDKSNFDYVSHFDPENVGYIYHGFNFTYPDQSLIYLPLSQRLRY